MGGIRPCLDRARRATHSIRAGRLPLGRRGEHQQRRPSARGRAAVERWPRKRPASDLVTVDRVHAHALRYRTVLWVSLMAQHRPAHISKHSSIKLFRHRRWQFLHVDRTAKPHGAHRALDQCRPRRRIFRTRVSGQRQCCINMARCQRPSVSVGLWNRQ